MPKEFIPILILLFLGQIAVYIILIVLAIVLGVKGISYLYNKYKKKKSII